MNTRRFFTALLSMGLLFTSITAFSQKSYQVLESQYFPPEPISGLIVNGDFSIEYITGERPCITVIGDLGSTPNLEAKITDNVKVETISVDDGTVLVKVSSDKNMGKGKLIVEGTHLKQIEISGSISFEAKDPVEVDKFVIIAGDITSAHVAGMFQSVSVVATGASSVNVTGTANYAIVDASGVAKVDISKLEYPEAKINASGISRVSANEDADNKTTISGMSSISAGSKISQDEQKTIQTILSEGNMIIKTVEGSDSTVMNIAETKIIIKDDGKTETITIGPCEFSFKQNKMVKWNRRKDKFNGHWGGIELGVNGYNTSNFDMDYPDGYEYLDLRFPKSMAFYLNLIELNVALAKNQKWGMLSGLGFEWHNYRFSHDISLEMKDGVLQGYDIGAPIKKTKLMACYMTVPLIFEFQTNNKSKLNSFHVGLGVVGGLRIGTHTKIKYENNHKEKERSDFYLNPLKLDATARVGWSHINLFATYSLTPMFRENRAPELYPWSVGITLLGW